MVLDILKSRRSIRKYKSTPVTKPQIEALLEAAMLAPSACNTKPWRFIAITNRAKLDQLAEVHQYAKMLKTAPLAIVVVALPATQNGVHGGLPEGFFPQDCAAATQNIITQAEAMGLGTCWCGVYPRPSTIADIKNAMGIPDGELPFCIIAVGVKDEDPDARGGYDLGKVEWVE